MENCPFCDNTASEAFLECEVAVAMLDGFPVSEGHTLVIPRRHVVSLFELSSGELAAIWDFVSEVRAVNLSPAGRRQFFEVYEQRMSHLITHPVFDYKVSYRRALELQFRLLSRVLTGEIPEYIPFVTR